MVVIAAHNSSIHHDRPDAACRHGKTVETEVVFIVNMQKKKKTKLGNYSRIYYILENLSSLDIH